VKEELAFSEALENDVFREKLGSSLRKLLAGVGIQAEVVSLCLTLQINKYVNQKVQEHRQPEIEEIFPTEWTPLLYPPCLDRDLQISAMSRRSLR